MFRRISNRLPLIVALPLLVSMLVLGSTSALILFFYLRADQSVLSLARQTMSQGLERVRERAGRYQPAGGGELDRFLDSVRLGENGVVYLLDGQGRLGAASTGAPAAGSASGGGRANPLLAASIKWLAGRPRARISERVELDGTDALLMTVPLESRGQSTWMAVSVVPMADILSGIHAQRRTGILLMAGTVLLTLLIGVMLAMYVARPIVRLTEHMRRIGHGHLDDDVMLTEFPEFMRLSFAINNMVEGLRERLKLHESLSMAKEVQSRLIPASVPHYPGLDIAGRSYYCDETGGDYFDYLQLDALPAGTAVIAIGDVSGHGIASAMVMASARGILRSRCHAASSLGELLRHMNEQILEDSGGSYYMTMLLVAVHAERSRLLWASAGHCEPLLLEGNAREFRKLDGADPPLGVMSGVDYRDHSHDGLQPGQLLLLATDGLWEATNQEGERLGMERLAAVTREHAGGSADEICAALAVAILEFCGSRDQSDDISFVVIKRT